MTAGAIHEPPKVHQCQAPRTRNDVPGPLQAAPVIGSLWQCPECSRWFVYGWWEGYFYHWKPIAGWRARLRIKKWEGRS